MLYDESYMRKSMKDMFVNDRILERINFRVSGFILGKLHCPYLHFATCCYMYNLCYKDTEIPLGTRKFVFVSYSTYYICAGILKIFYLGMMAAFSMLILPFVFTSRSFMGWILVGILSKTTKVLGVEVHILEVLNWFHCWEQLDVRNKKMW